MTDCVKPKYTKDRKAWGRAMYKYNCCRHPSLKFCRGKKKENKKED